LGSFVGGTFSATIDHDYLIRSPLGIVGVYVPSILFDEANGLSLVGPRGRITVGSPRSPEDELAALYAVGGVLLGSSQDAIAVNNLLCDDKWSRTTSYLCTVSENCSDALRRQRAIAGAEIVIIGCGGIGSLAAVLLAGSGVSSLTLVDGDIVERSNLNRQLFWTINDLGRRKVDVLKTVIGERYPELLVEARPQQLQGGQLSELVQGKHGLLFCADQPISLLQEIPAVASEHAAVACVSAGYSFSSAVVVLHGNGRSRRRLAPAWRPYRKGIMPSFGPMNAEVAGVATGMLLASLPERCGHRRRFIRTWAPGAA